MYTHTHIYIVYVIIF